MKEEIKITITAEELQIIVNALATQPYHQVAGLIPKLIAQANPPEGTAEKPDLKEVK
jgi:hypothetical protein